MIPRVCIEYPSPTAVLVDVPKGISQAIPRFYATNAQIMLSTASL